MKPLSVMEVMAAKSMISQYIHKTPLLYSDQLSRILGCQLYVKCENFQKTGSFKVRGVMNFLLNNPSEKPVTTYSSGNHGAALAWGAQCLGRSAIIFMPEDASPVKIAAVNSYQGEFRFAGLSSTDRQAACMDYVAENDAQVVPPFDHNHTIAGQGTVMLEIFEEGPDFEAAFIPVGGGGLLAGNALVASSLRNKLKVFSCEPESAADVKTSLDSQSLSEIEYPTTIADGLRNLRIGDRNWSIVSKHVAAGLTCKEDSIRAAMASYAVYLKLFVEPSGAASLACLWEQRDQFAGKKVVVYISGGNIAPSDYAKQVAEVDIFK